MTPYLADLFRRRDLVVYLVASGLKAQHRNTFLGYFWWLLDPLLGALIYYFVVVALFKHGGPGFGAYLLIGTIVWRWLGSTIAAACHAIVSQSGIITQVYLPKIVFPITTALTGLVSFGFGLIVLAGFLLFWGFIPGTAAFWLPYIIASQMLFTMALAAIVAYACVFLRDLDTLVSHGMRLWFYASPVIWREAIIPERLRWMLSLNPMTHFLTAYRTVLLENQRPDLAGLLAIAAMSSVALLLVVYLYSQYEHRIIKAL